MEVIYEKRYEPFDVSVQVREGTRARHLSFGSLIQTSMDIKYPEKIQLKYIRKMLEVLEDETINDVNDVLILGLGGGSLVKALYTRTNTTIHVVEIIPFLKDISETYFYMPKDDKRIKVYSEDAFGFVQNTDKKYDLVFVDIFDNTKTEKKFISKEFHTGLKNLLKDSLTGYVVFNNHCLSESQKNDWYERLGGVFNQIKEVHPKKNNITYCR